MRSPFVMIAALATGCGGSVAEVPIADSGDADSSAPLDTALDTSFCCENPPPPDVTIETTATPTFDPPPGPYVGCRDLAITIASATAGAAIYFTTDGTEPTLASAKYSTPIVFKRSAVFHAMATAPGFANSAVAPAAYVFMISGPPVPVSFAPEGGTYASDQSVVLSSPTKDVTMCFTRDGSSPTCDLDAKCTGTAETYAAPLLVRPTSGGVTLKAVACSSCTGISSVTTATYRLP